MRTIRFGRSGCISNPSALAPREERTPMRLEEQLPRELDRAIAQASANAEKLSEIGAKIGRLLDEDRHSPTLTAQVLIAESKRAALAVSSLAGVLGQIDLLIHVSALA